MNINDVEKASARRMHEITTDIALRLYAVRRPLANKAISRNADIDLLSDCVEDARDLVYIAPEQENPN